MATKKTVPSLDELRGKKKEEKVEDPAPLWRENPDHNLPTPWKSE